MYKTENVEYIKGKRVIDFCNEISAIRYSDKLISSRELLVTKYRLMRQILYAARDEGKLSEMEKGSVWDHYTLGIVFFEMLEGKTSFLAEDIANYRAYPRETKQEIELRAHAGDMRENEKQQMTFMLRKMLSLTEPWETIEEIISYLRDFLNEWVRRDEISLLRSEEFLQREEYDFLYAPYIKIQFEMSMPEQKPFFQTFEIMQGGIVPLAFGANIPVWNEELDKSIAGYLVENEGNLEIFLLEQEEMMQLDVGFAIPFEPCRMRVCSVQQVGYEKKVRRRRAKDIDLM